jgi:isocitrate/isopropylmalate dehydrogenase
MPLLAYCTATTRVLRAAARTFNLSFRFDSAAIGWAAHRDEGTTFPAAVLDKAKEADGVLLGPVSHNEYPPPAEGGRNPSGELRKQLDLFANTRPARSHPGFPPRCGKPVDLVIVRENTEGFYADRSMFAGNGEMMPTPDLALSVRKITREGSTRIAEAAFRLAARRHRKVTAVHKANVLRLSDGLYLECTPRWRRVSPTWNMRSASSTPWRHCLCAMPASSMSSSPPICSATSCPTRLSEISGSLGLAASLNAGHDHAVAQAQHGSAPDIAGKNIANPSSLIGSAAMLLAWLGERRGDDRLSRAAAAIEAALDSVIADPGGRTADMGGRLGTNAFAEKVAAAVDAAR